MLLTPAHMGPVLHGESMRWAIRNQEQKGMCLLRDSACTQSEFSASMCCTFAHNGNNLVDTYVTASLKET